MDARKFLKFMEYCKKEDIEPTAEELKAWWSLEKLRMALQDSERGK